MKKVIYSLFICSIMLCACNVTSGGNESGNVDVTASGSAVTAGGAAAETEKSKEESANKTNKKIQKKKIVRTVTD